jgi:hypothetical protein
MSGIPSVRAVLQDTPYSVSLSDDLGHVWQADEPLDVGGGNTGPTPEQSEQLLKVANACPMHKLLTGEVRVNTVLTSESAQR